MEMAAEHRPTCAAITLPDPDNMPVAIHVEVGGTIEWRSETPNYPTFEVEFLGRNPFNEIRDEKIFGGYGNPLALMLKREGEFFYRVVQIGIDNCRKQSGPVALHVTPCRLCPGVR